MAYEPGTIEMKDSRPSISTVAELRSGLLDAFAQAERPPLSEMLHSALPAITPSGYPSREARFLRRALASFQWAEVTLANFEDELLLSRTDLAWIARWGFELLSPSGVRYYAPTAMLIALEEGLVAAPLLSWLVDRLDPEWDGLDFVEEAFGHWGSAQVNFTVYFLEWAGTEFCTDSYDGQIDLVRRSWQDRRQGMTP